MKILFLFFTLLIASTLGFSQTLDGNKVTPMVFNKFQSQFPKAEQVEWKKDKDFYKAIFQTAGNRYHNELWYSPDGNIQKHVEEFSSDNLSENIKKYIGRKYKAYNIDQVYKITEDSEVSYKVQIEKYDGQMFLFFNEDGKRLK